MMVWLLFIIVSYGTFCLHSKSSIISMVVLPTTEIVLPTTEIIEPQDINILAHTF